MSTTIDVPIVLDEENERKRLANIRRQKKLSELDEARTFASLGVKIMRLKTSALKVIGQQVEDLGLKQIAHGKFILTSEDAQAAIIKIDAMIEALQAKDIAVHADHISDLLRVRLDYARLLMESGEAHLRADKELVSRNVGPSVTVPFPAGTPMLVAVNSAPIPSKAIEDK